MPDPTELFQRIDAAKAKLDAMRPLDREREQRLMQKFRLWWTYHSNAIEGNSLTQGETEMFLMEGLTAKGKPLKDHLDLRGHSNAVNYLLELVREKEVLTEAAIRELHKVLLVEPYRTQAITPDGAPTMKTVALGEYKTQPNHVRTPTGETHFYATPENTPAEMHALLDWFRAETQRGLIHPVEIAARFHHRFTGIHPFDDSNGRMSRLLMNLILMQGGYVPVVIRIGERNRYLMSLRKADRGDDDDFIGFISEHVLESLELSLRAAGGEEIAEPADIEKEIAVELLRFKQERGAEPEPFTHEVQQQLFAGSFEPLLAQILDLVTPLCELFAESTVEIYGGYKIGQKPAIFRETAPAMKSSLLPVFKDFWNSDKMVARVEIVFWLRRFMKAPFDAFSLSERIEMIFGPSEYRVVLQDAKPGSGIQLNDRLLVVLMNIDL